MTDVKDFEQWLDERAQALPRERRPEADLWPAIESRIAPARRLALPLAAAALLAGVAIAVRLTWPPGSLPAPGVAAQTAAESAADMDRRYRDALLSVLEREGPMPLAGDQARMAEADFQEIDIAQREIRRALDAQPDAAYLVSLLEQTHAQRMDLVQDLAGNPAINGGNDENADTQGNV